MASMLPVTHGGQVSLAVSFCKVSAVAVTRTVIGRVTLRFSCLCAPHGALSMSRRAKAGGPQRRVGCLRAWL
jgi:hypothetical protein